MVIMLGVSFSRYVFYLSVQKWFDRFISGLGSKLIDNFASNDLLNQHSAAANDNLKRGETMTLMKDILSTKGRKGIIIEPTEELDGNPITGPDDDGPYCPYIPHGEDNPRPVIKNKTPKIGTRKVTPKFK